jgi:hypothetical protein
MRFPGLLSAQLVFDTAPQILIDPGLPFLPHRPVLGNDVTIKPQSHLFLDRWSLSDLDGA